MWYFCPYIDELNPKDLCNSQGRIVRKDNDGKGADMIYLRSCGTAEAAAGGGTEPIPIRHSCLYLMNDRMNE
ncbi:hypothetical protein NXW53_14665 [Bacteroides ovatus]|nr:hypothetical protein [Bacteroides ovatus]